MRWGTLGDALDFWIGRVERWWRRELLWCFLDGIAEVGILVGLDGFEDAQSVVLCKLCLVCNLGIRVPFPDGEYLEKRGSGE